MSTPAAEALETSQTADTSSSAEATASANNSRGESGNTGGASMPDVDKISSPEDYRAAVEAWRAGQAGAAESDGESDGEEDGATTDEAEARGGESSAEEETDASADGEEGAEESTEETDGAEEATGEEAAAEAGDDDGDDDDGEGKKIPKRIRLTGLPEVKALAMKIAARNPDMSLAEAERRAKETLGVNDDAGAEDEQGGEGTKETKTEGKEGNLPTTIEETEAQIRDLKSQRAKALGTDMNFALAAQLIDKIEALQEHKSVLAEKRIRAEEQERRGFTAKVQEAKAQAVETYPDVTKADSKLVARMREIDARLEATKNPLFHSPEKYFKVAQMAANELGIAPRVPGKAAAKPVTKVQAKPSNKPAAAPARPAAPVATGSRRSTQPTAAQVAEEAIDKVTDTESYEALKKSLLRRR